MFDVDVNEEIGRDEAVVERERTRTPWTDLDWARGWRRDASTGGRGLGALLVWEEEEDSVDPCCEAAKEEAVGEAEGDSCEGSVRCEVGVREVCMNE
jgi:hypothetical protein